MIGLKFISVANPRKILASSSRPTDPSPSLPSPSPSSNNLNPPLLKSQPRLELQKKKKQNQRQLSVAEIERAIGAGIFRDRDTSREAKESKTLFDSILSNSEGDVEKKLRETGEWLIDKTEDTSASAGKKILVVVFKWILPLWILAFLVASGMVNLPFSTPFLDDLLL
ncbi:probable NAD(P)H dehydrogenase subunit CRR3, chloroplastic isoform X1 [Nicotiana tomentosiformis]|uniref:probable NAD(P)H dehydrogenase subunit CRR3, chloroplastic isoform X1 n=1 Tax=Nicotiana tomentosiformis TaxID=4098 RepID=UPI00051C7C78|nr:probable NAD(P)H dehydrogenase subunit CRR3, chloroplastic isoform X1 [Nicotiana tomentosiformis]